MTENAICAQTLHYARIDEWNDIDHSFCSHAQVEGRKFLYSGATGHDARNYVRMVIAWQLHGV
ncbi:hypothetical protein ACFQUU_24115 [Herbaspirillum sp. GCM10030257]|uniref:hypothetical protein n=1 Tax=Herbaspirillum sp. GCM10030257 TaxID=3273393 RepID=UPI00361B3075